MKTKLKRIFYIYSEATTGAMMAAGAVIEMACWAVLPAPISWLPGAAVFFFTAAAISCALYIYNREKSCNQ